MATTYVGKNAPRRGPYLKHAFAKYVLKGEDSWLQQRDVDNTISSGKGVPHAASRPNSIQAAALSSIYIPALAHLQVKGNAFAQQASCPRSVCMSVCLPILRRDGKL
jgi:hypothetical protein